LKDLGVDYVIIGHSERRQYFGEDDLLLRAKVEKALEHGLKVIFCIGETEDEYNRNHSEHVVKRQIISALFTLEPEQFDNVVIAYEPVWAIGTGKTATPEYAQKMHAFIRQLVAQRYGDDIAQNTSILYGGSIKPNNAKDLFSQPDVDGGLVGGSSLNANSFVEIVRQI
ncbi:MAG: triose-phosphate isomerase, partial [Chlorobi bacterium]|nr:triose-phosphate isomerase [Chlorobiota bacterium]